MPVWAIQLIVSALPIIVQEINALVELINKDPNNPKLIGEFKTLVGMQADILRGIADHTEVPA